MCWVGEGWPPWLALPPTPDPGFWPQVQVNRQAVALPYTKFGLQVYESGINYMVDIPELGALISYNGLSFSIRLPYRLFGNNTKGQCGEPLTPAPRPGEGGLAEAGHGSCSPRAGSPHCSGPHRPPSPVWVWSLWEASRSLICALRPGQMTTRGLGWSGGSRGLARLDGWAWCVFTWPAHPHRHMHQQHLGRLRAAQWGEHRQL